MLRDSYYRLGLRPPDGTYREQVNKGLGKNSTLIDQQKQKISEVPELGAADVEELTAEVRGKSRVMKRFDYSYFRYYLVAHSMTIFVVGVLVLVPARYQQWAAKHSD